MKKSLILGCSLLLVLLSTLGGYAAQKSVQVETVKDLVKYARKSNVNVTMKSGVYTVDNTALFSEVMLTKDGSALSAPKGRPTEFAVQSLLHFSGDNSTYNLEGVVVKLSSKIHRSIERDAIYKMLVTGDNNLIRGLAVEDEDMTPPKSNAIMTTIVGDNNTLEGVSILVQGSSPYGYGHLLGKGGANGLAELHKQSSLLVSGVNTKLLNCRVITRAFGHGIVLQGAVDTHIEGCYVEGEMRTTDEMLAETSGPAYDAKFATIYPPGIFEANRMMALSEDGVRTYPYGPLVARRTSGVTVVNTTVKNMRSGYDLTAHATHTVLTGCTAIECQEKGFAVGSNAVVTGCKGDAKYGPLLSFPGTGIKNCQVEIALIPTESTYKVPRVADVNGSGHTIKLTNFEGKARKTPLPIEFGMSFWGECQIFRNPTVAHSRYVNAKGVTLINETGMPIKFLENSSNNKVTTSGEVLSDQGVDNSVTKIAAPKVVTTPLDNNADLVGEGGVIIYNKGVAGNTSSEIKSRLSRDAISLAPELTIILVGANDMLNSRKITPYDTYRSNIEAMVKTLIAAGSDVMLMSALPADAQYIIERHDETKFHGHPDEVMAKACEIVKDIAYTNGCYFVDLHGEFVKRGLPQHNEDIYLRNQKNSNVKDGVHPTAKGYELMGEIIWDYMVKSNIDKKYKKIVCLGDSITKGSGASGGGTVTGGNYPSFLNRKFNPTIVVDSPKEVVAVKVEAADDNNAAEIGADGVLMYNKGIGGQTSTNMLGRIQRDVLDLNPDLMILLCGTNDLLNSKKVATYETYKSNIIKMVDAAQGSGADVILMSPLPADAEYLFERHDKSKYHGHPDEVMAKACDIVKSIASEYACHFVDLHAEFVSRGLPNHNKDNYIRNEKNSNRKDGVHPTPAGYKLMSDIIWAYFVENKLEKKYKTIVCIGDSITKGGSGLVSKKGENYPSYLHQKLNK